MKQCERILRHLQDHGTITQAQAMAEYGCMRLAARISDLKDRGYHITSTTGHGRNRYGEKTVFAVYSLVEGRADG
jgi:hypothetical protein